MRRSPPIPFGLRAVHSNARLVLERREAIDLGVGVNWGFRAGTEIPLCETALTLTTHTQPRNCPRNWRKTAGVIRNRSRVTGEPQNANRPARPLPVYPDEQTFSESIGMSQTCQFRTHALQQTATMFDAFTCRWRNCPQHQSLTTRSRQTRRLDGAFECTDWT
jgi:hypothetical protein